MKRILTLLTLLFACTAYAQEVSKTEDNIVFFYNAELKDGKNTVCGGFDLDFHVNTYSVLQSCGVIDSMFVRCNEKQLAEIDNKNWTYKCSFQLNANQLKNDCAYLNVQNIDGNCKLYINKRYVRQYNNSFMSYRDNVKKYLKKGKNTIELRFSLKDSLRTRQRSPQYFYGWDWYPKTLAPHINAIWLSFEQESLHIDYANIQTVSIETDSAGNKRAEMLLNVKFNKPLTDSHTLIVSNAAMDYPFAASITEPMEFELTAKDTDYCTLAFVVNNAGLWYPNGAGNQTLYNVNLSLDQQENILKQLRFGIRSVKLIRQADKWGESFYFCVNGRDIFAKGANYIMTYDDVQTDVVLAARANMNMLRIWGGSDYGSDEFYDYCDEYGIMVWQDYPFSTELYPANKEFVDNVRQDAVQNMMRISAHPSLALVCGNNEIWEGWNHWGWKNEVKDTVQAVKDYDYLFRHVLDSITKQYVPTVDYIHSSPLYHGWGSERSLTNGDCHYYGVWWADSNFETYTHKIPRFMSEYGFQGAMNPQTAEIYCTHPYTKDNEDFAIHEKHPRGFELTDNRSKEWFGEYKNDDQYILYSQLTQQEGMKTAMEAHRMHRPYCMGTLFWQYNDPYPCIGWGCIEASKDLKPLYYTAQKAYQPVIFAVDKTCKDSVKVYVCSDLDKDTLLTYRLSVFDTSGFVHYVYIGEKFNVKADSSALLASIAYRDINRFDANKVYLWVEGFYGDELISNYAFFCYPKDFDSFEKYLEVIYEYYFDDDDK